MQPPLKEALLARLTALADDELLLAQRAAEWTGHAPILEEDIALANLAQDELGHATLYYQLAEALGESEPDEMVFFRDSRDFLSVQFVELPKGDWAFTMLRHYLFDAYEFVLLDKLSSSSYEPLAHAAAKIRNEELYHLRHTHAWVERLGLGTAESNRRMQQALDILWPLAAQLFVPLAGDRLLQQHAIIPDFEHLYDTWRQIVVDHLHSAELTLPDAPLLTAARGVHSAYLADLLTDLQSVARSDPEANW